MYEGEQPQAGIRDHKGLNFTLGEDTEQRTRILDTLDALKAITRMMGRHPGWKNLLWVSDAFPLQFNSTVNGQVILNLFHKEGEEAMRELAAANMVLYPVSPHGLSVNQGMHWPDAMLELAKTSSGQAACDRRRHRLSPARGDR